MVHVEEKYSVAVAWIEAKNHPYEDRYRLLTADIPLVGKSGRGELFGCFDGIGGAPLGMQASQAMADCLIRFYQEPERYPATLEGLRGTETTRMTHLHEKDGCLYNYFGRGPVPEVDIRNCDLASGDRARSILRRSGRERPGTGAAVPREGLAGRHHRGGGRVPGSVKARAPSFQASPTGV